MFKKDDRIAIKGHKYQCIIADEEMAVFGEVITFEVEGGEYDFVSHSNLFSVSQLDENFEHERI